MSVSLSSYSFDEDHPPIISTNEVMPARYQLRAKFIDPVTGTPYQATELFNNNGLRLDNLPAPAVYTSVSLRWIKYNDTDGTREVGPETIVSVTITDTEEPCNQPSPSTSCECGTFEEPDIEDDHKCSPIPVKRKCDAPAQPQAECGEQNFTLEFTPDDPVTKFRIISILYDESCDEILDQTGDPILTIVA